MSNTINDDLIQEAWSYILSDDLESTPLLGMIKNDLKENDLDMLWVHIMQARDMLRDE